MPDWHGGCHCDDRHGLCIRTRKWNRRAACNAGRHAAMASPPFMAGGLTLGQAASAAGMLCGATLLILPAALVVDHPWTLSPGVQSISALFGLALLSTAIAFVVWFRLITTAGPSNTSLVTFPDSIYCAGVWHTAASERPSLSSLLGLVIILVGLAVTQLTSSRPNNSVQPTPVNILTVNLLFSTLVFWIAARIYVLPKNSTNSGHGPSCCRFCCCIRFDTSVSCSWRLAPPTPAFQHRLPIQQPSVIYWPCWQSLRFQRWRCKHEAPGSWCSSSTSRARWICWRRSSRHRLWRIGVHGACVLDPSVLGRSARDALHHLHCALEALAWIGVTHVARHTMTVHDVHR